MYVILGY